MTLTDFLLARITEDKFVAQAAIDSPMGAGGRWFNDFKQIEGQGHITVADASSSWYAGHVTRWDPTRVLAECEAKRRIIELDVCMACDVEGTLCDQQHNTRVLLASAYADHPDFDPSWKLV